MAGSPWHLLRWAAQRRSSAFDWAVHTGRNQGCDERCGETQGNSICPRPRLRYPGGCKRRGAGRSGDCAPFIQTGFADIYLADPKATFASLQCHVLPAFTARGIQFVLRDKPNQNLMVLLFGQGVRSAMQQFKLSREVREASVREFEEVGSPPA